MDRSSFLVTAICVAALVAALLGSMFVTSGASAQARADLTDAARGLLDDLEAPRFDPRAVERRLAPGLSARGGGVYDDLDTLSRAHRRLHFLVAHVRVEGDGSKGVTELAATTRGGLDEASARLHWVRTPGGRWGLEAIGR